jgi:hypothetical protein
MNKVRRIQNYLQIYPLYKNLECRHKTHPVQTLLVISKVGLGLRYPWY